MRSIVSSLGVVGVLLGLAMPVSAEVLLQAGATETKLVTAETYRPTRHQLTAEAGQTVVVKIKLANNNPNIISRLAVYQAGKYTPLSVEQQVSYRTVNPQQKSQISHLIVLTLPGDSGEMTYEIEPLFDYQSEPLFDIETVEAGTVENSAAEGVAASVPSTVRYRMTVETATVSQQLLLEAQTQQAQQNPDDEITAHTPSST